MKHEMKDYLKTIILIFSILILLIACGNGEYEPRVDFNLSNFKDGHAVIINDAYISYDGYIKQSEYSFSIKENTEIVKDSVDESYHEYYFIKSRGYEDYEIYQRFFKISQYLNYIIQTPFVKGDLKRAFLRTRFY